MKIKELQQMNVGLQRISDVIIRSSSEQNYDLTYRTLREIIALLGKELDVLQELDVMHPVFVHTDIANFLQSVLEAQKVEDCILIGDLVRLQLIPFLEMVQAKLSENFDLTFFDECWAQNIRQLEKKDADLAVLARQAQQTWLQEDNQLYWLEPTSSGLYTLASKDEKGTYYLHSNYNPQVEADAFARSYYDMESAEYVILGFGLGYQAEALSNLDESINITIYENDLQVLVQAMMANDLSWLWERPNVVLVYDNDLLKLSKKLSDMTREDGELDGSFIIHYPSLRHVSNIQIREKLKQLFIRDSGSRNARILMNSNFRENQKHATGNVDELKEKLQGKRVVIVAAGPSLDKNISLLKNKPEDVVIVATGTVFRKLIKMEVDIDYLIVSDANARVYSQIRGLEHETIPMIFLSTAYHGFAKNYHGARYIVYQQGYEKAEEEAGKQIFRLYQTGGSVVTVALDICLQMECESVTFVGLDLAYTDNLAHAEGTSRRVANDIEDLPKVKGYALDEKGSIVDTEVYSSHLFDLYRNWLERRLRNTNIPVYDATEGGSVIQGMRIAMLKDVL